MQATILRYTCITLLHLLPLLVLVRGYTYGACACLLLICIPYIKQKKLAQQLSELESRLQDQPTEASTNLQHWQSMVQAEVNSIQAARTRWRALTFLR